MIDWLNLSKIYSKNVLAAMFEKLAFAYVQDVYSKYDWETTPQSGDGNKDAHLGKGAEFDVWEEAKYKGFHPNSGRQYTVRRQDLDTTILSGLQQGNVRLIVFISNSVVPPELYERVAFSSKLKGIEVTYILKAQIESWIYFHKDIFRNIFGFEPKLDLEKEELFNIESISIFDMHYVNFGDVTRVKEMIIRERYILNVTISSSCKAKATIQNSVFDILNHPDFTQNNFELSVGVNSLRFLISPRIRHTNRVNIRFRINEKEFNAYTPDVIIEESSFPTLTYSSQLEIISTIKKVINLRAQDSDGLVVTVFGRSSIGKSFVLKNLYAEYLFRHESLYVDFDINEFGGINERYLCRVLIFLNYGNVFLYNPLRTSADATRLKKLLSHYAIYSDISARIRNRLRDGCIDYTTAVSVIYELSTQFKGFIIPSTKFKLSRLLFIDDVQNLSDIQFALIKKIVCQLDGCKTNILIVLSATQDAFKSIEAQETYETLTPNNFRLSGLNKEDKKLTLKNHFSLFTLYSDCLVHCGQSGEAEKVFEQILDNTKEDSLEYLEIRISLLNQWFWSIKKLNRLIGDSLLLQHKVEQLMNDSPYSEVSYRLKKCESSCYNRCMVTLLLLDEYDSACNTYINWLIKSAQRVSGNEYKDETAVTIMDFARGISYYDIALSKTLMSFAYSFMCINSEKHFRRLLICKIDLLVLQNINGKKINLKELEKTIRILAQNNFRSECFKAVLKYFAVKIIDESAWLELQNASNFCSSSFEETINKVHQCMLKLKITPKKREKYLYNILMSYIEIKGKSIDTARQQLQEALKFVESAGKSYSKAILHNLKHIDSIQKIAWFWENAELKADTYYLDCRFW